MACYIVTNMTPILRLCLCITFHLEKKIPPELRVNSLID